ncbi:hypothetical protein NLI96_g472 [Meripilus lineatus]|uniref:Uncharacterized protein n=1 Tax=Meripilus lineatus TaxID=2056292 RepID=A0AAD5VC71_9APHY|nr:hypothetical protein NLI96_g472 [Physisporinus lineatus]
MPSFNPKLFSRLVVLAGFVVVSLAATYTVTVGIDETDGKQGLGFDPSAIRPAVGDTIEFTFQLPSYIKDPATVKHSATRYRVREYEYWVEFFSPRKPQSRQLPFASIESSIFPSNVRQVNDTQPLWFFSSANNDCKSGMVLAVNPDVTGSQTAAAFKENAQGSNGTPATSAQPSATASQVPNSSSSSNPSPSGSESSAPSPSGSNAAQNNGAISPSAQLECIFAGIVAFIGLSLIM